MNNNRALLRWLDADMLAGASFRAAVTHRSAGGGNNERLEYLGDAVLGMLIAEHLYRLHPNASEGDLSRLRAKLVRGETLAGIAKELHLSDLLVLGPGEVKAGGHRRDTILADALEAIIGAIYLEKGFEAARVFVLGLFQTRIANLPPPEQLKDAKTRLQEYLQARNLALPEYRLQLASGEPHAQNFVMRCLLPHCGIETTGEGGSKREAEQRAAARALAMLP
ncbi:MAG: ribonuclease III [Gammaproteobacteria bacterium]